MIDVAITIGGSVSEKCAAACAILEQIENYRNSNQVSGKTPD